MQLDYERYKSRAEKLEHNAKRSDRENIALAKHQVDLESAQRVSFRSRGLFMLQDLNRYH
jgi:hypothetical protein